MADIEGLQGFNSSGGTNELIATFGNDIHILSGSTWQGQGQPVTSGNKADETVFLDKFFWVNGTDDNRRYDGTDWTNEVATKHAPLASYIHHFGTRIYLGNLTYPAPSTDYPSRVWFSDLPKDDDIEYGLEYGTDLDQIATNDKVFSTNANFKTRGIKVGDPLFIKTGDNAGQYTVASVDTQQQLTLTEEMDNTVSGSSFWVGSNWFDVATDDNDVIQGLGDNSDRLLVFKRNSLWRYDGQNLRKVKGVPGTTSARSIVNIKEFTFYFHETGIWRYDGVTSQLVSRGLQHYIDGISASNFDDVVAWQVGEGIYRIFVGDVTNTPEDISVTNCIIDYDSVTQTITPGRYNDVIRVAGKFRESGNDNIYIGTDSDNIMQDNSGNSDNGTAIPWFVDTGFHFPFGNGNQAEITSVEVHTRNGRGVSVRYKLYGTPNKIDKEWSSLGSVKDRVTEFKLRDNNQARGFALMFSDSSTQAPPVIDKVDVFWKYRVRRIPNA